MSLDYHGQKPVTKTDVKLAKKHLKATIKLEKSKTSDHLRAAKSTSNSRSKAYNMSHAKGHQKDIKQRQTSLKTISRLHPV